MPQNMPPLSVSLRDVADARTGNGASASLSMVNLDLLAIDEPGQRTALSAPFGAAAPASSPAKTKSTIGKGGKKAKTKGKKTAGGKAVGGGKHNVLDQVVQLLKQAEKAHKAGDLALLKQHLQAILDVDPDNAMAHFNLGVLFRDANSYADAERHLRAAIKLDPTNPTFHLAVGELMQMMRHLLFAATAYEAALDLAPNGLSILSKLTEVRVKQRMPRQVIELSRRALALDPQALAPLLQFTTGLLWEGENEEAAEVAARTIAAHPKSIHASVLSHTALNRLGRLEEANAVMAEIEQRCLAFWDECAVAIEALLQVDEGETSAYLLRQVIAKTPDFVPALQHLGRYAILQGDANEGLALMSRVVELDPDEGDAQTSVSLTLIRNGQYEEGWARHHWRWKRSGCEARWDPPVREWQGERLEDGGVVLWREQGIGDMIMYAAPAIACRSLAKPIAIETNQRLRSLLQRSFPDMKVVCREDLADDFLTKQNIVAHCPIGDLPHLLKIDMADYPGRDGFLTAQPAEVVRLRERYQLLFPGKRLVGISWRSGNSSSAIIRSVDLPQWMPIFETPDCAFISLQYGDVSADVELLRQETDVEVYIDREVDATQDMDRFVAQIAAVDVVISVDNSTVHASGALGKETWVLVPTASDWRWLTPERSDTVWYRSLTLLRQTVPLVWTAQIDDAAARLRALTTAQCDAARLSYNLRCAKQSYQYGDAHTAELYFRQILQHDGGHHEALAGLGRIAIKTGHLDDAIRLLRQAVDAAPDHADYLVDLAKALVAAQRHDQAFAAVRRALDLEAGNADALLIGIEMLRHADNADEAANYCARLLRVDPANRGARFNLAQLQASAGDFEVAEMNFRRLLDADPDDKAARFSLGCLALRNGDLRAGWAGYADRFAAGLPSGHVDLALPSLLQAGVPDAGSVPARVAVRPEPALKDQILFLRWLTKLRQDGVFVAAELDPRLLPLIDQRATRLALFPTGSLTPSDVEDLELTVEIAMADLGQLYGLDIARLGDTVPYLQPDIARVVALRGSYRQALNCDRLVGICWRGGDMAIPLAEWLPILQTKGVGFVALQAGPVQQEMHEVFGALGLAAIRDPSIDPLTNLRSFLAQIASVDLVISIDEVPAYLAGALGAPTVTLLPQVADWRWFSPERHDSPWYPSMQLYRQGADGSWAHVMQEIAGQVAAFAATSGTD